MKREQLVLSRHSIGRVTAGSRALNQQRKGRRKKKATNDRKKNSGGGRNVARVGWEKYYFKKAASY